MNYIIGIVLALLLYFSVLAIHSLGGNPQSTRDLQGWISAAQYAAENPTTVIPQLLAVAALTIVALLGVIAIHSFRLREADPSTEHGNQTFPAIGCLGIIAALLLAIWYIFQ